jgi:hypothetical protein
MSTIRHIDVENNPPTLLETAGSAWLLDVEEMRKKAGTTDEDNATVCAWIVYAPWAHPFWAYYLIAAVHLRETKKYPMPKIILPGATHEIFVAAMDPEKIPDIWNPFPCTLRPLNFVGQWVAPVRPNPIDLDQSAAEKVEASVREILAGTLNPDTDCIQQWVQRYSGSNLK